MKSVRFCKRAVDRSTPSLVARADPVGMLVDPDVPEIS